MVATTASSDQASCSIGMAEPLLIDQFMPRYDLAVVHSRVLRAPPELCFETVVDLDLLPIPVFRVLIGARGLPLRLADDTTPTRPLRSAGCADLPAAGHALDGLAAAG